MNSTPDWLKPGALVEFAFCVGEILDVAVSETRVMVLVTSPKGIWRNHPAEWLEYKPDAIKPATFERAQRDLQLYREYIVKQLNALDELDETWLNANAALSKSLQTVS